MTVESLPKFSDIWEVLLPDGQWHRVMDHSFEADDWHGTFSFLVHPAGKKLSARLEVKGPLKSIVAVKALTS